jgi:hypothetical protein
VLFTPILDYLKQISMELPFHGALEDPDAIKL